MATPTFAERRPFTFTVLIELTVIAVYLAAGTVDHFAHLGGLGVYALANAALVVVLSLVVTRLRWWSRIGFRAASPATLLWALPMLLPAVLNLFPGLSSHTVAEVAGFLALALAVGFVEETAFRGLMLRALLPRGTWLAILVTTALFSITHLMNILAGEAGLQAALQLLYSAAIGFAFTALVLRTGVIWPLVLAHALIDFVAFLQDPAKTMAPGVEIGIDIAVTVLFIVFVLLVLPRVGRPAPAGEASTAVPDPAGVAAARAAAGRADSPERAQR